MEVSERKTIKPTVHRALPNQQLYQYCAGSVLLNFRGRKKNLKGRPWQRGGRPLLLSEERAPRLGWAYRSRRGSAARALSYLTSDVKRDPVHSGFHKRMERVPRPGWAYQSRRGTIVRALSYLTSDIKRDPVH